MIPYKVIVIDDNPNTVRSLNTGIDWPSHGFELVGTAYDGVEGGRLIQALRPHVVITDIRMPGTDGLTLIEQHRELLHDSRVILITGYDRFQYAAQAIKLSVFDFILKPIDDAELSESLIRARKSLDRDRESAQHSVQMEWFKRRARMLSQLTGGVGDTVPNFCDPGLHSYCFLAASIGQSFSQPILQRLSFQAYPESLDLLSVVMEDVLVMFCGFRQEDTGWKNTVRSLTHQLSGFMPNMLCAVSRLHTNPLAFRTACQEARHTLLEQSVFPHRETIVFCENLPEDSQLPYVNDMQSLSQELADTDVAAKEAWAAILHASGGRMRQMRVLLMLYSARILQKQFAHFHPSDAIDAIDTAVYDIPQLATPEGAQKWFFRFRQELDLAAKNSSMSTLIRNVLAHINTYAADGVSLESVAKQFHISPHYLSSLVRKETGVTFQQHVIQAKLEVSKKLLNDTRMRVEDIAYAVGYENYISFYNMFKRIEQKTPTEYRFRSREETDG